MKPGSYSVLTLLLVLALSACSAHVPEKDLPGTYVVHYPYGVVVLLLHRNGTFTQTAGVFADPLPPKVMTGTWRVDHQDGDIEVRGALHVADAFGRFNPHWRTVSNSSGYWAPECLFFRLVLNGGAQYLYVKQGDLSCPILGVLPRW